MSEAVRTYGAMVDATKKREDYKKAQLSAHYSRVGPLARQKLDDQGKILKENVLKFSNDLKRHLETLERFPEMSNTFLDVSMKIDEQQISDYIKEVREWIEDTR